MKLQKAINNIEPVPPTILAQKQALIATLTPEQLEVYFFLLLAFANQCGKSAILRAARLIYELANIEALEQTLTKSEHLEQNKPHILEVIKNLPDPVQKDLMKWLQVNHIVELIES